MKFKLLEIFAKYKVLIRWESNEIATKVNVVNRKCVLSKWKRVKLNQKVKLNQSKNSSKN